jgi:hypothetical protein
MSSDDSNKFSIPPAIYRHQPYIIQNRDHIIPAPILKWPRIRLVSINAKFGTAPHPLLRVPIQRSPQLFRPHQSINHTYIRHHSGEMID